NSQLSRDPQRMHRTGATKGDHRTAAIIEATLGGMHAECSRNILVDDLVDAPCRAQRVKIELLADASLYHLLGFGSVELHLAAKKEIGIEISENQVGIRQGRACPTAA